MSAQNMKFKDNSFDFIICKDSFHHFKDPVKVLKEMYRVLKIGGYIYSVDLRRDIPNEIFYQITQLASELNIDNAILYFISHNASYTIKEMETIVEKAGIKKFNISSPTIDKNFLREYDLKSEQFLTASDYLKDKWTLIIKK